jgi:glycosyltransferase involved in cell wall biosynthesis
MKILILAPVLEDLPFISKYSRKLEGLLNDFGEEGEKADLFIFNDVNGDEGVFDRYQLDDYQNAAEIANRQYDACILQHHPQGYGGADGDYLLTFVSQLQVPLLTIFHDVSSEPTEREKAIVNYVAKKSDKVMVFSRLAIEFLEHYYKVNRDKINRTDYGVNVFDPLSDIELKEITGFEKKNTILTCGPMCSLCGFETIINALAGLQKNYPSPGLVIINTGIDNQLNSEYKKVLKRLAAQRGVSNLLKIVDYKTLDVELELIMNASDVYIASGIHDRVLEDACLSTAVSSGAAVLSTPTWYAKELLEDQKGSFFAFRSINELTAEIVNMLRSNNEANMYRENALLYGAQNSWAVIVKKIKEVVSSLSLGEKEVNGNISFTPAILPDINLQQLLLLNSGIGFVNDSHYGIPDYSSGYSLLANSMALQVLVKANVMNYNEENIERIKQCIGLIKLFRAEGGHWSSALNYRMERSNEAVEYELGYTVLALSGVYSSINDNGVKDSVYSLILHLVSEVRFTSSKAIAAALIGVVELLKLEQSNQDLIELMKKWTSQLLAMFPADGYSLWQWHEEEVSEQVGLLPLALLHAYELLKSEELLSIAKRAIRFTERYMFSDARYNPKIIGKKKGMEDNDVSGSANSLEAYLMTAVYAKLFKITKIDKYMGRAISVHNWYLGDNSIGRSLFEISTGGCYISHSGRSVNPLITTSSTCAYWLSHFKIHELYFDKILSE